MSLMRLISAALTAATAWIVVAAGSPSTAEQAPAAQDGKPLEFLRVYAPADRLKDWPLGNVRYLPVKPEDFERLVRAARVEPRLDQASSAAALRSAQYKAKLVGDELTQGTATLQIHVAGDAPAVFPLEPCRLSASQPVWAGAQRQPAKLGLSAKDKLGVLVERSGTLQFDWSLRGRRDAGGIVAFALELPACPATQLDLELPPQTVPTTESGVVLQETRRAGPNTVWRIELGGHHRVELRVVPADEANRRRQMPTVRESTIYDVSPHGVEIVVQLEFDASSEPLRQLVLSLDPGVRLIRARSGDSAVEWSAISEAGTNGKSRVVLPFAEPIRGAGRTLRLSALAPLKTGQPWQLPRIRPEGVFWQEGVATLLVGQPLVVEQLAPVRARQIRTSPLAAPRAGESLELQYFAPDASATIVLGELQAAAALDSGVALEFGRGQVSGKMVASLRATRGERFRLDADVSRQWIVDAVESIPAEAIDDWSVEGSPSRPSRLNVRLARALSPARPLRLVLSVRRLNVPPGQPLDIDDLTPVRFRDQAEGRRLVALCAAEPYGLKFSGEERLTLIKPQEWTPAVLELFLEPPRGLVFKNDAGASALRVLSEARKPSYSATIRVEASAYDRFLGESYWFRCVPEGASVGRLLVHFSLRRSVPLRWTLAAGEQCPLTARPIATAPSSGEQVARGETWEIVLGRPQSAPFELRASRAGLLIGQQSVSLAAVPEAGTQRGTLIVRSTGSSLVRIQNHRLKPLVPEPAPAGQYQTTRAAYAYDPARDVDSASGPAATLSTVADLVGPPSAWVWDCQLESRYQADGVGHHRVVYRLQVSGGEPFRLRLPECAPRIQGIWVDDARAAWNRMEGQGEGRIAIDLPPGKRFPVLCILFISGGAPLRRIDALLPPLPQPDVPVLSRHWTVWLPPGYEAVDVDPRWQLPWNPPPTWRESVFGPLARPADARPFNPLNPDAWAKLTLPDPAQQAAERKTAQWLQQLGRLAAQGSREPSAKPMSWGSLLANPGLLAALADAANDSLPLALVIDRLALARLGIAPDTPVQPPSADTDMGRGIALLHRTGLVLLAGTEAILVTGASQAASWRRTSLTATENDLVWSVRPGPLAEQMRIATGDQPNAALLPAAVWEKAAAEPQEPWTVFRPAEHDAIDTLGWSLSRLDLSKNVQLSLSLVHGATVRAFRWIAFLALFALGWWKGHVRPCAWIALAGLAACAALLLPEGYAAIASGAFLGILGQWAIRLAFRRDTSDASSPEPATDHGSRAAAPGARAAQVGVFLLAAATILLCCGSARGEEPSAVRPAPPPGPSVFIPIDDKQQPTGDKIYVPEDLYSELQRRAVHRADEPQGWLLAGGTYRGVVSWQATPERLVLTDLKATFDLEVFERPEPIRIPLGSQANEIGSSGVFLDGRAVAFQWTQGAVELRDVPPPGQYRLEIAMQTATLGAGGAGFDLKVPRLVTSRLELSVPPDAPAIDVPSAVGSAARLEEPPRLTVDLGPADRLAVRWQQGAAHGAGVGPALDVEQLLWLRVQPGSVVLQTRLKSKAAQGQVSQISLTADPRLRLLRPQSAEGPNVQVSGAAGQPQTVRLEFARPVPDQVVAELAFLVTGASGVGNLRLPGLAVSDARISRRWLAVSVDSSLVCEQHASERLEAVAVPTFLAAWGASESPPLFAYSLGPAEPSWSLATRPSESRTAGDQTLALSVAEAEARVSFDARLNTTAGATFQYRLSAPKELNLDSISVMQSGGERVARWSRDKQGAMIVFLSGPVAGNHDFALRGRLPVPSHESASLGLIRLEGVEIRSHLVQLYRQPSVDVKIEAVTGLTETSLSAVEEGKNQLGRLLKCWSAEPSASALPSAGAAPAPGPGVAPAASLPNPATAPPGKTSPAKPSHARGAKVSSKPTSGSAPAKVPLGESSRLASHLARPSGPAAPGRKDPCIQLTCRPNRPKVCFDQITSLRTAGDSWNVQVDLRVHVTDGVVDELQLEVPSQWAGPYKIAPAAASRTIEPPAPGQSRILVLRPRLAIEDEYRFTLSGPLTLAAGERVAAPQIGLRGAEPGRRFLVLPTQAQLQPIGWETQGLQESRLPSDFAAPPVAREALVAYEVRSDPYRATITTLQRPDSAVQVHLADIGLAWQADGSCYGTASFDLGPSALTQCTFRLPSGLRPLQVFVAGAPSPPVFVAENRWEVTLGGSGLPQAIEVLFTGTLPALTGARSVEWEPPALEGLPVRQTLWTISGPRRVEARLSTGLQAVDQLQHDWTRLQNITALVEQGADVAGKDPEEMLRWYRTSVHRWSALRREVERLAQAGRNEAAQSIQSELQSIDRKLSRIAARVGADQNLSHEAAGTLANGATHIWLWTVDRGSNPVRYVASGGGTPLVVHYQPAESGRLRTGLWTAAGILAVTCLLGLTCCREALGSLLRRWPILAGLMLGLAWWLWLAPSILGLAVVAFCLLSLGRSAWRRRRGQKSLIVPIGTYPPLNGPLGRT